MKELLVLVEGQTEETFVRDVLAPHLDRYAVWPVPVLLKTKRTKSGATFKGGITNYARVRSDAMALLRDTSAIAVTTMVDYYGLPSDFPGYSTCPAGDGYTRVRYMQDRWAEDISDRRFRPFLVLHEFEALLYADIAAIAQALPDDSVTELLSKVRRQVTSPEEIDESPATHPSAHLLRCARGYQKASDGPLIAKRIGLPAIRKQCPHFDEWVTWLERLA